MPRDLEHPKVKAMRTALVSDVINAAHEANRSRMEGEYPSEEWFQAFLMGLEATWTTLAAVDPKHRFPTS